MVKLAESVIEFHDDIVGGKKQVHQVACSEPNLEAGYPGNIEQPSLITYYSDSDRSRSTSSSYALVEGPSEESLCCHFSNSSWLSGNDSRQCSSSLINSSCNEIMPDEWGRNDLAFPWGGRIVGRRQVKSWGKGNCGLGGEEYDTFINIFEGGSVLYCNMSFEVLLDVRKQLEELGFPCKAVNDGLWLQVWNSNLLLLRWSCERFMNLFFPFEEYLPFCSSFSSRISIRLQSKANFWTWGLRASTKGEKSGDNGWKPTPLPTMKIWHCVLNPKDRREQWPLELYNIRVFLVMSLRCKLRFWKRVGDNGLCLNCYQLSNYKLMIVKCKQSRVV